MVDTQLEEIIGKLQTTSSIVADKIRYIRLYHLDDERHQQDLKYLDDALQKILYSKYLLLTSLAKQYEGDIPPYVAVLEEVKMQVAEYLPEIIPSIETLEKKIMSKTANIEEIKKTAEKDVQEAKKILLQY